MCICIVVERPSLDEISHMTLYVSLINRSDFISYIKPAWLSHSFFLPNNIITFFSVKFDSIAGWPGPWPHGSVQEAHHRRPGGRVPGPSQGPGAVARANRSVQRWYVAGSFASVLLAVVCTPIAFSLEGRVLSENKRVAVEFCPKI